MTERYEEVEGIPSGILTCFVDGEEVGVTKCSPASICIRVPEAISDIKCIEIAWYDFHKGVYQRVKTAAWQLEKCEKERFFYSYEYGIQDETYAAAIRQVQQQYMAYIRYKMTYTDSEVSKALTSYPAEADEVMPDSYDEMEKAWLSTDFWDRFWQDKLALLKKYAIEAAICLDTPEKYRGFLQNGKKYFSEKGTSPGKAVPDSFLTYSNRVYIGNQFCPNLFPKEEMLYALLKRAGQEKLRVTLCVSYLRDNRIEEMRSVFDRLADWCRREERHLEIVCNDIAYLKLLETNRDVFVPVIGLLLNKRRKDPRYSYKKGFSARSDIFMENAWNGRILQDFAAEYGAVRYEYETCGYQIKIATGRHSLHLPLYQTNTAAFCTLHAACTTGERGKQHLVEHCTFPCEQYVFAYPEHLKMLGKYNSLFSYDNSLLLQEGWLEKYLEQGIDRLVWNL